MLKIMMTEAARRYRAARTRQALERLSDNTLRDIGISRREIGARARGGA